MDGLKDGAGCVFSVLEVLQCLRPRRGIPTCARKLGLDRPKLRGPAASVEI